jgi:hypothetical protein
MWKQRIEIKAWDSKGNNNEILSRSTELDDFAGRGWMFRGRA